MLRRAAPPIFLSVLGLLTVGSACDGEAPAPKDAPAAVALVNGEPITATELEHELAKVRREGGALALRSEQDLDRVRRRMLEKRIDQRLLAQAARKHQVVVGADEIERAILRLRSDYPGRTFEKVLAKEGIPYSELRDEIRDRLLVQQLISQEVNVRVAVTDAEIDAYYKGHPKEFEIPDQVHALQIVVKTEEQASQVLKELRRGDKFGDLARKYSIAPEAAQGGDLGWFARGVMPSPIDETCFQLSPGRVSDIVDSPYGYHIFKVVERKGAQKQPLDDALRRRIEADLRREKEEAAQHAYLEKLRNGAKIRIDEKVLAEVR